MLGAAATVVLPALLAPGASAKTVWLCRPGLARDPCTPGLSTTAYSPTLAPLRVVQPRAPARRRFDCFYVYPTVSDQPTTLSNRRVEPEERSIALYQTARFSQYCRVFAPMYRQVTVPALLAGKSGTRHLGQHDVVAAFQTYLRRYNDGRPFVLIGHSQGALALEQLVAKYVDFNPQLRARLLSAILLGGDVLVKDGSAVGGTFQNIPACRRASQVACVIAFSTFDQPVPADSAFGRTSVKGEHVLCVNPVALQRRGTRVDTVLPSAPFAPGTLLAVAISLMHVAQPHPSTVWSSLPGAYSARCSSAGGAHVLQVSPLGGATAPAPSPAPSWGLHLLDANIELGNLLAIVRREAAAWPGLYLRLDRRAR
ncbi:MAG TPA: DUF3089 domain-containing protein [Solirubrobacteraceae bacterium]|nr:DUF3089 domain-containing protein [Solirubrobacteraceae bacterium]